MEKRFCLECNEELIGRSDKKFCDDQCRNIYNNKLKADNAKIIKSINNKLRKNRRILALLNPGGKTKIHKDKLLTKGFDFKYYTHTYTTKEMSIYTFCYDYGLLQIDKDWYLIVRSD